MSYVSLHTHSDGSLLDGMSTVEEIAQFAADNGQTAVALTDHGNLYRALSFQQACDAHGVKPIIGCEMYVAEGGIEVRDQKMNRHLILLAKNDVGLRNLITLVTRASLEGMYYKPRVDMKMLGEHAEGLICLSACLGGELAQAILNGGDAYLVARTHKNIFGDDYYLEMQDHGQEDDQIVNHALLQMHNLYGFPLVATQDSHYTHETEADLHDTMLCMQTNGKKADDKRFHFSGGPYSLLTEDEMSGMMGPYPDAVSNSGEIAKMCNARIATGHALLPSFNVPDGYTANSYLAVLCTSAVASMYPPKMKHDVMNRLYYELEVIESQNLSSYFLIVHDIVTAAQNAGAHIGPGRGSAAGSIVAYLLGITTIDPLKYNLVFERFLNMARFKLPDIDLDIDPRNRHKAIQYVSEKYGADRVAQIVTINTFAEKNAVQSVARVFGESPPYSHDTWAAADELEGRAKNLGRHAAGIVIAPEPLLGWVPLTASKDPNGAATITQWEMHDLEDVGLLKIDLLGLSNLSTIYDTVELINGEHGHAFPGSLHFRIEDIPLDDIRTFDLISRGDTVGVFQLDSWGGKKISQAVKPRSIEDIGLAISLNRPGPLEGGMIDALIARKQGMVPTEYLHTLLEPILAETFGVIVYQEQVMRIASDIAGYSMGDADIFRQAVGKKDPAQLAHERKTFFKGAVLAGLNMKQASTLFEQIEYFAGYGFNLSHAIAYATVGYQTAYLKAHYPVEFFTALLNARIDRPDKFKETMDDVRRHNITVLQPNINTSGSEFTVDSGRIRYGLTAIKGFGAVAFKSLETGRRTASFATLDDVVGRCNMGRLNEGAMKALIDAGAMSDLAPAGILKKMLAPTMKAWKRQKENDVKIKAGQRPVVTRVKK